MDKATHEVRRANWKAVIEQCQARPKGQTVKQWLLEQEISEKRYYYWLRKIRQEAYNQINSVLPAARSSTAITFAEIPVQVAEDSKSTNITFQADAVIQSGTFTIGLSNSISESLLKQMLEVIVHVD